MMNFNKVYQFSKLQYLEKALKSIYNQNQNYNKLNEKKKNENVVILSTGENRNIFSGIPKDVIELLKKKGDINTDIFDLKKNEISINNYWDLLDTIKILLNIIEFDLLNAYLQSDNLILENE